MKSDFPVEATTAYPVVYRTYARKADHNVPRETVEDIRKRVIPGLYKLGQFTESEKKKIEKYFFNNQLFPSGRFMWCGGTEFSEKPQNFYSLYNCSNVTLREIEDFGHIFNFLMQGNGAGAKYELQNIDELPPINSRINLEVIGQYGDVPEGNSDTKISVNDYNVYISVGDSRIGWVEAFVALIVFSTKTSPDCSWNVTIDVSHVREAGKLIKGFGGVTKPEGLIPLFKSAVNIINKAVGRKLTPIECSLLTNNTGLCTVAGNIRRSAKMDQFSKSDKEGGLAKTNLWTQTKEGDWVIDPEKDCLRMANFTRVWHEKPTKEEIHEALVLQFNTAEGAIQYAPEAVARANADLLDTEDKKQHFIELYCQDKEKSAGYLSELWELKRFSTEFPMDQEELQHRMSRYGLNPLILAA